MLEASGDMAGDPSSSGGICTNTRSLYSLDGCMTLIWPFVSAVTWIQSDVCGTRHTIQWKYMRTYASSFIEVHTRQYLSLLLVARTRTWYATQYLVEMHYSMCKGTRRLGQASLWYYFTFNCELDLDGNSLSGGTALRVESHICISRNNEAKAWTRPYFNLNCELDLGCKEMKGIRWNYVNSRYEEFNTWTCTDIRTDVCLFGFNNPSTARVI